MIIEISNQDKVSVSQICPHGGIEILGYRVQADLIPCKLGEFDVIL